MANDFKNAFRGIDAAIKQGTARALNRALSSTKTKTVRQLREQTGLKTEVVKSRTRSRKAAQNRLGVILGIAIKFAIALRYFDPKEKTVRVKRKGDKKRTAYTGITVKLGRAGRQLIAGAFPLVGKTGEAVIGRKGAFNKEGAYVNPSAPRYALAQLKTKIFADTAKALEAPMRKHIVDTFDGVVAHEIDYAIQNKFKANK